MAERAEELGRCHQCSTASPSIGRDEDVQKHIHKLWVSTAITSAGTGAAADPFA